MHTGKLPAMSKFAQAYSAKAKFAVVSVSTTANTAAVVLSYLKLRFPRRL
jgi:hypothetical protein